MKKLGPKIAQIPTDRHTQIYAIIVRVHIIAFESEIRHTCYPF